MSVAQNVSTSKRSSLDMPAPARRVVRIDVWPDLDKPGYWLAGWSAMELGNGDDYTEVMSTTSPGDFIRVSRGVSARSSILAADIPAPAVWREYESGSAGVEALHLAAVRFRELEHSMLPASPSL